MVLGLLGVGVRGECGRVWIGGSVRALGASCPQMLAVGQGDPTNKWLLAPISLLTPRRPSVNLRTSRVLTLQATAGRLPV